MARNKGLSRIAAAKAAAEDAEVDTEQANTPETADPIQEQDPSPAGIAHPTVGLGEIVDERIITHCRENNYKYYRPDSQQNLTLGPYAVPGVGVFLAMDDKSLDKYLDSYLTRIA